MAECIVLKGGSGADLDVVTARAPDILAGKVGVDKEGEPVVGAMPDCRKPTKIRFWRYNNNRFEVAVDPGLHGCSWADNYYEYLELGDVGIEPWKFRADTTIGGVKGGIPIQGADAGNNYAWNINWANWGDGNIFMGVRDGHLLSGVGWIRAYINNFWASNIKKGVNIGGVVGTFEGYVPTATDLYFRGNNIKNFTGWRSVRFDDNQLYIGGTDTGGQAGIRGAFNTTGFTFLNINGYKYNADRAPRFILYLDTTEVMYSGTRIADVNGNRAAGEYTISINIGGTQRLSYYGLMFESGFTGLVYRIWLS